MTWNQGFSGRSLRLLFSAPTITQTRSWTGSVS
jgi:hypothetical protein